MMWIYNKSYKIRIVNFDLTVTLKQVELVTPELILDRKLWIFKGHP